MAYSNEDLIADEAVLWVRFEKETPDALKERTSDGALYPGNPYDDAGEVRNEDAMPGHSFSVLNSKYTLRAGYEFNGYWTTKYTEDPNKKEIIDGREITACQYYDENFNVVTATNPSGKWMEVSPDATRLYAHWKYKIELDTNVYDSDERLALDKSTIALDLGGYSKAEEGVFRDVYGNLYTVVKSANSDGDDDTLSILAIDGAPIKLPMLSGRAGYNNTQTWGVTQKTCGQAADSLALADGYTAQDGTAVDIKANAAFAAQLQDANNIKAGVYTIPLYADWTNKALYYEVTLRSAYADADGAYTYLSDADRTIKVRYDRPLLVSDDANITATISAPAYKDGSEPANLVFLGYVSQPNAPYTARNGVPYSGTRYIMAADDEARTPVTATDASTNGVADYREAGNSVLYALWGYPEVNIAFDLQDGALDGTALKLTDGASASATAKNLTVQNGTFAYTLITKDAMPGFAATNGDGKTTANLIASSRPGFTFNGFWTHPYKETGADTAQYYDENGACVYGDGTWDKTHGVTLYAHWRYTVYLNLNTFNTDDEVVVAENDNGTERFAAQVSDIASGYRKTEQSDMNMSDGTFVYAAQKVEGEQAARNVSVTRYSFTAIDGAPIQLPQVNGRDGYNATNRWGTAVGAHGTTAAASRIALDGDGVSNPFRAQLVATGSGDRGYVLYADWTDKAQRFTVDLVSTYIYEGANGDVVLTATDANPTQLTAVYDQPLLVDYTDGNGVTVTKSVVPPVYDNDGSIDGRASTHENLVFKGFYTVKNGFEQDASGNEVNTTDGTCYISAIVDENGNVTGAETAVLGTNPVKFRELAEGNKVTLYALWGYPGVTLKFDLQGGIITVPTGDDIVEGFTETTSTGANLSGVLKGDHATAPVRDGYVFAGWWTTPYDESAKAADGTRTDLYFYGQNDADGNAAMSAAKATWDLYAPETTLYAHWRYTIEFDTQLSGTADIADVTTDPAPEQNGDQANGDASLTTPDGTREDKYGNRYVVTTETASGAGKNTVKKLVIEAIAGAPVQLPSAQERRENDNGTFVLVGYDPTWAWQWQAGTGNATVPHMGEGGHYFTTDAGAFTEDGLPCKIAGQNTNVVTLKLFADWTDARKLYTVRLNYGYDYSGASYTAEDGHAKTIDAQVHYDSRDYVLADGADAGAPLGKANGDLNAVDSANATASAVHDGTAYDNLDFAGITTAPNLFLDSTQKGTYPSEGTLYWNAAGVLQRDFRAIKGDDVKVYTADATRPFNMYAAWAQPTREVKFNLFDSADADWTTSDVMDSDSTDGAAFAGDEAFQIMKGDVVDAPGASGKLDTDKLQQLAQRIIQHENRTGYVFGGFWTAPSGYQPYEEAVKGGDETIAKTLRPVCYYLLDRDNETLTAAARTAADTNGWLTAANTSETWLEDGDTTLYAHWKYAIDFKVDSDDRIPVQNGASDMLAFGGQSNDATDAAIPFDRTIDTTAAYTDARGYLTFGMPIVLPADQDAQTMNGITRIRDFTKAPAYGFTETRGLTGYRFAGWSTTQGAVSADANLTRDDAGKLSAAQAADTVAGKLSHDGNGRVTLYAQWDALEYDVTLQHYPQTWADVITRNSVKVPADKEPVHVTVRYDQAFGTATGVEHGYIVAPELAGFHYLGYYANPGAPVSDQNMVDNAAGIQFFNPVDDAIDPGSQATDAAWFAPVTSTADSVRTATIYAYYGRVPITAQFKTRDVLDGTLQVASPDPEASNGTGGTIMRTWNYGDKLDVMGGTDAGGHVAANAGTISWPQPDDAAEGFSRHGYTFDGWYFYPSETASMSAEEKAALHRDASKRVYVYRTDAATGAASGGFFTYDGSTGSDAWVLHDDIVTWRTVDELGIPGEERNYTFYASWVPKTYTVKFVTDYRNTSKDTSFTRELVYGEEYGYADLDANGDPAVVDLRSSGDPYVFIGWHKNKTLGENADKATVNDWLLDMSGYDPLNSATWSYTVDQPNPKWIPQNIADTDATFRFMPRWEDTTVIELHAVWNDPGARKIVLFSGSHGSLSGAADKVTAGSDGKGFAAIDYNYATTWNLNAGRMPQSYGITLSWDDGYEFLGWAEVSPMDLGAANNDSFAWLKTDTEGALAKAARIQGAINASDYRPQAPAGQTAVLSPTFPKNSNVKQATYSYQNPYNGKNDFSFRDVYLVAVYKLVDNYEVVLDLGAQTVDSTYPAEMSARIVDVQNPPFTETGTGNSYHRTFSVESGDFMIPDPQGGKYDFKGWFTDEARETSIDGGASNVVDGKDYRFGLSWLYEKDGALWVDVKAYASAMLTHTGGHTTTLYAKLDPKTFTVRFCSDPASASDGDTITLSGLDVEDSFSLPYPASRGQNQLFSGWGLRCVPGASAAITGEFAAGSEVVLKDLLYQIATSGEYLGQSLVDVDAANDTITFDAWWDGTYHVTVPLSTVNVKIDPATGTVLSAADRIAIEESNTASSAQEVKIVSLRYERQQATDGQGNSLGYVFGDAPASMGKAYLSVYADLETTGDTTQLFARDNVDAATGLLASGVNTATQKRPLLIDLSRNAVYADTYPWVNSSTASFNGIYDNGHLDAEDDGHGLADHGFRPFGKNNNTLPIRYSLLLRTGDAASGYAHMENIMDYAPLLATLATDTSDSHPIAQLYYTISLA